MRLGTSFKASAPVLSTTRGSSGMKGRRTAWLPAAMMARLKATTFLVPVFSCPVPVVSSTSTWLVPTKWP
ncbi:MAG: hypothetical protein BWX79_02814 [Alphaproteobacteria bacterium ADurb.Bin100]|nr:MAG: hypothetical protein BWX79_02814 [Alphaproteobacteria bacterium ADurb.Bin100]